MNCIPQRKPEQAGAETPVGIIVPYDGERPPGSVADDLAYSGCHAIATFLCRGSAAFRINGARGTVRPFRPPPSVRAAADAPRSTDGGDRRDGSKASVAFDQTRAAERLRSFGRATDVRLEMRGERGSHAIFAHGAPVIFGPLGQHAADAAKCLDCYRGHCGVQEGSDPNSAHLTIRICFATFRRRVRF